VKVIVIGGGAAGFFAAIRSAELGNNVALLEKDSKLLSKVKVSGGGRCNVTNSNFQVSELIKGYPRGAKFLRKAFGQFASKDTVDWFEGKGVKLKAEPDGRMFPTTDDSQTIVDCLLQATKKSGVQINKNIRVRSIEKSAAGFLLKDDTGNEIDADKVIVASGGSPKKDGLEWLEQLDHNAVDPVPSLFTFNIPGNPIKELMGLSANVRTKIQGSKLSSEGPILITHWGFSGPAVLKLSAWGARELAERNYNFNVLINWSNLNSEEEVRANLNESRSSKAQIKNLNPTSLAGRLWDFLLNKAGISPSKLWNELGKKDFNRLVNTLFADTYEVKGKTTFKEEFVTCGGLSLAEINPNTMESRIIPGLFFAGEIMDIDGITGGYNFQAAWTTGWIAGGGKSG